MKIIKKNAFMYLCYLSIISMVLVGCGKKVEKEKAADIRDKIIEYMIKPDAEKVALLSIKYNIEAIEANNILEKYLAYILDKYFPSDSEKNVGDNLLKEMEKPNLEKVLEYQKKIDELSKTFKIPKDIVASIIIDYKIWTICEEVRGNY